MASECKLLDRLPHRPVLSSVQTGNPTMTSDPTEDTTFADLGLRPELLGALSGLGYGEPMALVLVPTRELAMQVSEAMHRYGRELGARILPVYGGSRSAASYGRW